MAVPSDASPLAAALQRVASPTATGCLQLRDESGRTAAIYVRSGLVYDTAVPGRNADVGARLLSLGAVSDDGLAAAKRALDRPDGRALADLLVSRRQVGRDVVEACLAEQLLDDVTSLVAWDLAAWRFRPGVRTRSRLVTPVPVADLLTAVAARVAAWERLLPIVGGAAAVPRLTGHALPEQQLLGAAEWSVLCRIDGARTLARLAADSGLTLLEIAAILAGFVHAGAVTADASASDALPDAIAGSPRAPAPAPTDPPESNDFPDSNQGAPHPLYPHERAPDPLRTQGPADAAAGPAAGFPDSNQGAPHPLYPHEGAPDPIGAPSPPDPAAAPPDSNQGAPHPLYPHERVPDSLRTPGPADACPDTDADTEPKTAPVELAGADLGLSRSEDDAAAVLTQRVTRTDVAPVAASGSHDDSAPAPRPPTAPDLAAAFGSAASLFTELVAEIGMPVPGCRPAPVDPEPRQPSAPVPVADPGPTHPHVPVDAEPAHPRLPPDAEPGHLREGATPGGERHWEAAETSPAALLRELSLGTPDVLIPEMPAAEPAPLTPRHDEWPPPLPAPGSANTAALLRELSSLGAGDAGEEAGAEPVERPLPSSGSVTQRRRRGFFGGR